VRSAAEFREQRSSFLGPRRRGFFRAGIARQLFPQRGGGGKTQAAPSINSDAEALSLRAGMPERRCSVPTLLCPRPRLLRRHIKVRFALRAERHFAEGREWRSRMVNTPSISLSV